MLRAPEGSADTAQGLGCLLALPGDMSVGRRLAHGMELANGGIGEGPCGNSYALITGNQA